MQGEHTTPLIFEARPDDPWLISQRMIDLGAHRGGWRNSKGFAVVELASHLQECREEAAQRSVRYAIGSEEFWQIFPELRDQFYGQLQRRAMDSDVAYPWSLGRSVVGDRLIDGTVWYPAIGGARKGEGRSFKPSSADLRAAFPQLYEPDLNEDIVIEGKAIFFCDDFTFYNAASRELLPGVRIFSGRELIERSELRKKVDWDSQKFAPDPFGPPVPSFFTTAILVDEPDDERAAYSEARISRLLACASIVQRLSPRVSGTFKARPNGWNAAPRRWESWQFPFSEPEHWGGVALDFDGELFQRFLKIGRNSTFANFVKAKEDCRLLALETAADSRSSSLPPLQLIHTWMAVERLLPFRHETSLQLALALSALSPVSERAEAFERAKRSYALRSEIAHGYSFKRDAALGEEIAWIGRAFRRLMSYSLAMQDPGTLRDELLGHVLGGEPLAFAADADRRG